MRIAAIQARPSTNDVEARRRGADVPRALELLREAKARGAEFACLPELFPLVGEAEVAALAAELGMWVLGGFEHAEGDVTYNVVTFIDDQGRIRHRQQKVYPTSGETEKGYRAGAGYEVVETPFGRLGAVICADFAFADEGVRALVAQKVDVIFNPAWWFALGEGYASSVIGRHLEYGVPIIGVDIAPLVAGPDDKFPPAGGYTTVAVPPLVRDVDGLGEWFRTKPGGANTFGGWVESLGTEEGMILVDVDVLGLRDFPGYWYSPHAVALRERQQNPLSVTA